MAEKRSSQGKPKPAIAKPAKQSKPDPKPVWRNTAQPAPPKPPPETLNASRSREMYDDAMLGLVMAVLEGDEDRAKAIVPHAFRAFATMDPENPASKQWVAAVGAQGE